jgi:hypothetical protein
MTRGLKGCYLYSVDPETNAFLKSASSGAASPVATTAEREAESLPFEVLAPDQVQPFKNCVPCFPDIKVAAGAFATHLQPSDHIWIALPEGFSPRPGYFVVKVQGESMNRRIPNGSWCLFRSNPVGSREGRVVLVQHRDISDHDFGACTVKIYHSTKSAAGDSWKHSNITLSPDSTDVSFETIHLAPSSDDEFRVVGELVAVISN